MTLVQKTLKNQKGLTLIELLAVIVILGIIAAIAVPAIGGIISKSQDKAIVTEAVNIISAAKLAHASTTSSTADATLTWDLEDLKEFMPAANVKHATGDGTALLVTYLDGVYSITGHDATNIASGEAEHQLASYLTTGS